VPVEKLTRERRRQQTRDVLIAAATEVFAQRGFGGASLEEIAETAGFTRGAIYKNFAGKEDLFFAVTERLNEAVIESFREVAPTAGDAEWDFASLGQLWRASADEFEPLFAIGLEYELYVLRNPDARARALSHWERSIALVASFIAEIAERTGMQLRLPADILARILLATADGLAYVARVYGDDLFSGFLEVLNHGMVVERPAANSARSRDASSARPHPASARRDSPSQRTPPPA
jgi:AcrR family transcriptional regulator